MQQSERDDLVNSLVAYGLTPVQAQTYMSMLRLGRTTAKTISLSSDINRVDVYRALKRLSKLGLIEEALGSPSEFLAAEPELALNILVDQKFRQVDRLKTMKTDLEKILETLLLENPIGKSKSDSESDELFLKVLSGEQVFRRLKSLISGSNNDIIKVFSPRSLILYDRIGIPELESAKRGSDGVSIRAVTEINRENYQESRRYSQVVDLRHSDSMSSHLRYTVVDHSLLLLPVGEPPENLNDAVALWTNSKALIVGLLDDFEKLWAKSISADKRADRLEVRTVG